MCRVLGGINHDHTAKANAIQYLTRLPQRRKGDAIDYPSKLSRCSQMTLSQRFSHSETRTPLVFYLGTAVNHKL